MEKIIVNRNQEYNPVVKLIRNVGWEYSEGDQLVVDYRLGQSTGLLFLSVRYHRIHSNYIYERMQMIPKEKYRLMVILLLLDDRKNWSRNDRTINEITKTACLLSWTVIVAWSDEEAARWLEALHSQQHKTTDLLREKVSTARVNTERVLCEIPGINKTDAKLLMCTAGSLNNIASLKHEDILKLRGFGKKKTDSLFTSLDAPLRLQ